MTDPRGSGGQGGGGAGGTVLVDFHLTPEEWVDLAVAHNRGSPVVADAVRQGQLALGGITVILGLLGVLAGYGSFALLWLFAGAVGVVLLPRQYERAQHKQYASIARGGITNGMFGPHRVSLLDEGILDETDAYQRLTRWHAVERVEDGPGAFMIYFGSDAFLPVPHSAFRDAESLRAFSERFFSLAGRAPTSKGIETPTASFPSSPRPAPPRRD